MLRVDVAGRSVAVHPGAVDLDPLRPAVLFIHGAGNDHSVWRYQTRRLTAAGWTAVAPDLPGHGRSDGPALESIEEMADWTEELIDELELDQPVVVGHSMGSLVALTLATRTMVSSAVLAATTDRMRVHPDLLAAAERGDHLAVDLIVGWSHTGRHRYGGHPESGVWTRQMTARLNERHLPQVLGLDLHACNDFDALAIAPDVTVPVLVINGTEDRMTPAKGARTLAEAIPDSQLHVVEGGGHMAMLEMSEEFNGLLDGWLERSRHP